MATPATRPPHFPDQRRAARPMGGWPATADKGFLSAGDCIAGQPKACRQAARQGPVAQAATVPAGHRSLLRRRANVRAAIVPASKGSVSYFSGPSCGQRVNRTCGPSTLPIAPFRFCWIVERSRFVQDCLSKSHVNMQMPTARPLKWVCPTEKGLP